MSELTPSQQKDEKIIDKNIADEEEAIESYQEAKEKLSTQKGRDRAAEIQGDEEEHKEELEELKHWEMKKSFRDMFTEKRQEVYDKVNGTSHFQKVTARELSQKDMITTPDANTKNTKEQLLREGGEDIRKEPLIDLIERKEEAEEKLNDLKTEQAMIGDVDPQEMHAAENEVKDATVAVKDAQTKMDAEKGKGDTATVRDVKNAQKRMRNAHPKWAYDFFSDYGGVDDALRMKGITPEMTGRAFPVLDETRGNANPLSKYIDPRDRMYDVYDENGLPTGTKVMGGWSGAKAKDIAPYQGREHRARHRMVQVEPYTDENGQTKYRARYIKKFRVPEGFNQEYATKNGNFLDTNEAGHVNPEEKPLALNQQEKMLLNPNSREYIGGEDKEVGRGIKDLKARGKLQTEKYSPGRMRTYKTEIVEDDIPEELIDRSMLNANGKGPLYLRRQTGVNRRGEPIYEPVYNGWSYYSMSNIGKDIAKFASYFPEHDLNVDKVMSFMEKDAAENPESPFADFNYNDFANAAQEAVAYFELYGKSPEGDADNPIVIEGVPIPGNFSQLSTVERDRLRKDLEDQSKWYAQAALHAISRGLGLKHNDIYLDTNGQTWDDGYPSPPVLHVAGVDAETQRQLRESFERLYHRAMSGDIPDEMKDVIQRYDEKEDEIRRYEQESSNEFDTIADLVQTGMLSAVGKAQDEFWNDVFAKYNITEDMLRNGGVQKDGKWLEIPVMNDNTGQEEMIELNPKNIRNLNQDIQYKARMKFDENDEALPRANLIRDYISYRTKVLAEKVLREKYHIGEEGAPTREQIKSIMPKFMESMRMKARKEWANMDMGKQERTLEKFRKRQIADTEGPIAQKETRMKEEDYDYQQADKRIKAEEAEAKRRSDLRSRSSETSRLGRMLRRLMGDRTATAGTASFDEEGNFVENEQRRLSSETGRRAMNDLKAYNETARAIDAGVEAERADLDRKKAERSRNLDLLEFNGTPIGMMRNYPEKNLKAIEGFLEEYLSVPNLRYLQKRYADAIEQHPEMEKNLRQKMDNIEDTLEVVRQVWSEYNEKEGRWDGKALKDWSLADLLMTKPKQRMRSGDEKKALSLALTQARDMYLDDLGLLDKSFGEIQDINTQRGVAAETEKKAPELKQEAEAGMSEEGKAYKGTLQPEKTKEEVDAEVKATREAKESKESDRKAEKESRRKEAEQKAYDQAVSEGATDYLSGSKKEQPKKEEPKADITEDKTTADVMTQQDADKLTGRKQRNQGKKNAQPKKTKETVSPVGEKTEKAIRSWNGSLVSAEDKDFRTMFNEKQIKSRKE